VAAATQSQTRGPAGLSSLPAERLHTIWGGAPSSSWGLGFRINEGEQVLVAKMGGAVQTLLRIFFMENQE
jgi:hypothetical protein